MSSVNGNSLNHALEVAQEPIEREFVDIPIGQPVAARVVADQQVLGRKGMQEMTPDWTLPVIFEVIEPIAGFYKRRSVPGERVGDSNPVRGRTETYRVLLAGRMVRLGL